MVACLGERDGPGDVRACAPTSPHAPAAARARPLVRRAGGRPCSARGGPARRRFLVAGVTALVAVLATGCLLQQRATGSTGPGCTSAPATGPCAHPVAARTRFLAHQQGQPGVPVTYDGCGPIHVVVNDADAPPGADGILERGAGLGHRGDRPPVRPGRAHGRGAGPATGSSATLTRYGSGFSPGAGGLGDADAGARARRSRRRARRQHPAGEPDDRPADATPPARSPCDSPTAWQIISRPQGRGAGPGDRDARARARGRAGPRRGPPVS